MPIHIPRADERMPQQLCYCKLGTEQADASQMKPYYSNVNLNLLHPTPVFIKAFLWSLEFRFRQDNFIQFGL